MNNVLQKTKSITLEIQQWNDTITPQAIDQGNRSPRTPHQSTLILLQLPSSSFSKVEYTYGWYSASGGK